jgi:hypothetical protein
MNPDNIIKAEANCFICSGQLEDGTSAVMKMYYRLGFANFIRGIILTFRAQREYRILRHMAGCRIPCTIPLSWTYGYGKEVGFYDLLYTRYIPDAISLEAYLSSASIADQNIDFGPLFLLLYNMHQCGVYHGALSTKNILRRLRKSKPKLTMTLSRVSSIAALHGAKLIACPRLSIINSGHRYALMVKTASS